MNPKDLNLNYVGFPMETVNNPEPKPKPKFEWGDMVWYHAFSGERRVEIKATDYDVSIEKMTYRVVEDEETNSWGFWVEEDLLSELSIHERLLRIEERLGL
jgi:hypothetical protein